MSIFELTTSSTAWKAEHEEADVTSCRFSKDGTTIAVGAFNGNVYIRSSSNARLMYRIQAVRTESPITAIKWNPNIPNTFICSSASGFVSQWHTETGQNLWTFNDKDNEVFSLDISPAGTHFVTGGSDAKVRLYSMENHVQLSEMKSRPYDQSVMTGHKQRVYSTIFKDDDIVFSGGWDNTVLMWDLRTEQPIRDIFGPHISGEAMAIAGNTLITGSARDRDQLQFWDIGTGKNIKTLSIGGGANALFAYTLSVTPDQKFVAVGGSGMRALAFFRLSDYHLVTRTEQLPAQVNCVDFNKRQFCLGLADSTIYVDKYSIA